MDMISSSQAAGIKAPNSQQLTRRKPIAGERDATDRGIVRVAPYAGLYVTSWDLRCMPRQSGDGVNVIFSSTGENNPHVTT